MTHRVIKFLATSAIGAMSGISPIGGIGAITATSAVSVAGGSFLLSATAQAQQVYRIVGADGKVTFSDKPPLAASEAKVTSAGGASGRGTAMSALPYELRQVASKYPVTLYTGDNCGPCASARAMLTARGIPFAEKAVITVEDAQALQRISGDSALPFATVGGQQLKGYADSEWTQFLNAAGYPATSVLPANYRQPPATPLVALTASPPATRAAVPAANPAAPAAQTTPAVNNPAGIKF